MGVVKRQPREAKAYVNESLLHGIQVLEALEGTAFEPVTTKRVADRANLPYDKVRRCLMTLELKGWSAQSERGWRLTPRFMAFCQRAAMAQPSP